MLINALASDLAAKLPPTTRIGFDLVHVSRIAQSLARFGARFEQRLFTSHEIDYAHSGHGQVAERLAARFAAKEATIKALRLSHVGVNWRDLEVLRKPDGECHLVLHGPAAELAKRMGVSGLLLSMSHDGDYAGAMVAVLSDTAGLAVSAKSPHEQDGTF